MSNFIMAITSIIEMFMSMAAPFELQTYALWK